MSGRRAMGALEADVMARLWAADRPLVPSEVRDALGGTLAYTTVMTILGRLWEKGLAQRERRGRAYAYSPTMSEAELAAHRMRATLDGTTDPAMALSRFADELTASEAELLGRILDGMSRER